MQDVTPRLAAFREAARHLWNTAFLPLQPDRVVQQRFGQVCRALFEALVLAPLGIAAAQLASDDDPAPRPIAALRVLPLADGIPIHVNRSAARGPDWDDPTSQLPRPDSASLEFVRFFDFDLLGRRDLQYVEVRIRQFAGKAELTGRAALVHCGHVRFVHLDDVVTAGHATAGDQPSG